MLGSSAHGAVAVVQAAAGQEALEKKVGMLETHQKEIHDALQSMENEAASLYQVPDHTCTNALCVALVSFLTPSPSLCSLVVQ